MEEIWKDIKGFEGLYQVSNLGRVKSLRKKKVIKTFEQPNGYWHIILKVNKKRTIMYIHRLVAMAFILNPENKRYINHIDSNKSNNVVTNLEWVSHKENMNHAFQNKNLLLPGDNRRKDWKGYVNIFSKDGFLIVQVNSTYSASRWIKKKTNRKSADPSFIQRVCQGKNPSAYGFIFKRTKEKNEKYFVDDFDT